MLKSDCFIGNRMTVVDKVDPLHHRSKVMIHGLKNPCWTFAEFDSEEQLRIFVKQFGLTYELESEQMTSECGMMRTYRIDKRLLDADWDGIDTEGLPDNARKIKALSFGRIVDCFVSERTWTVLFFRPNPEAYGMYHPLPIDQHMKHHEVFGRY